MAEKRRHRSRTPEEKRRDTVLEVVSKGLVIIAVLIWIPYLTVQFIPFLRSCFAHNKINLTTMCYSALRVLLMLVPIVIITPEKFYTEYISLRKIKILSKLFGCLAFLFFMCLVVDIISYNVFGTYEDKGLDPIALKMLWGNLGINGMVFCTIQSIYYLILWKKINGHKKDIVTSFAVVYALYMLLPIATGLILRVDFTAGAWSVWFDKNIWFFISNAFLLAGLVVAAQSRRAWSRLLWQ